jgi:hypothetical protein
MLNSKTQHAINGSGKGQSQLVLTQTKTMGGLGTIHGVLEVQHRATAPGAMAVYLRVRCCAQTFCPIRGGIAALAAHSGFIAALAAHSKFAVPSEHDFSMLALSWVSRHSIILGRTMSTMVTESDHG